nr:uncharacterized protein LOC115257820 [Aedes albopictus]
MAPFSSIIFLQIREAQRQEAYRIAQEQKLIAKQQQIVQSPSVRAGGRHSAARRSILQSHSAAVGQGVQFARRGGRKLPGTARCAMYKAPIKYSPHSNYVSAELSRDASELQKPTSTNAAVIRFYRYVQAARDGQDQRDCRQTYSLCTINIDKKK